MTPRGTTDFPRAHLRTLAEGRVHTQLRTGGLMGGSRLMRWGLVIVSLGSSVLALWLFLAPFLIQVFEGPVFEVGEIVDPSEVRADLAADCSAPFRQVFSSPLEGP